MNIKQLFKMGKRFIPLIPIFGGWKAALVVFALLQYAAPLALKALHQLQADIEANGNIPQSSYDYNTSSQQESF